MNCDPIARTYRWLEYAVFGRELERRRFRYLAEISGARRALVLGDGDGRFLKRLLETAPSVEVDLIDSSREMLRLARERAGGDRVHYHCQDARSFTVPENFDLIVTHFFLDCLSPEDLEHLIDRLSSSNAVWLISEFRQPDKGARAVWAWLWIRLLYFCFGLTTGLKVRCLTDHRPLLRAGGFHLAQVEESWFGLLASELWTKR